MSQRIERKFTKPTQISKHLNCPICADIYNEPLRLFCCHTFCTECLVRWTATGTTCPVCRTEINPDLIGKDLIAEKIIMDLEVQCINKLCDWKGHLDAIEKHVKSCPFEKPPEWLNSVSNSLQARKIEENKELAFLDDEAFQERLNEEVTQKSLLERLYTKDLETRQLMESVFDRSANKPDRRMTLVRRTEFNAYNALFAHESSEGEGEEQENKNTNIKRKNSLFQGSDEKNSECHSDKTEEPFVRTRRGTKTKRDELEGDQVELNDFKKTKKTVIVVTLN